MIRSDLPLQRCLGSIANSCSIIRSFQSIANKFDYLFSKRAFYMWYVGGEMESREVPERREDLASIIDDYLEFKNESQVDEEN